MTAPHTAGNCFLNQRLKLLPVNSVVLAALCATNVIPLTKTGASSQVGRTAALGDAALEQALTPGGAAQERRPASARLSSSLSLAEVSDCYRDLTSGGSIACQCPSQ